MNLKAHYTATPGYTQVVSPQTQPVTRLDFGLLLLEGGHHYQAESGDYEVGLVLLTGGCTVQVDGQTFAPLGDRASVFAGRASAVYVPCQARFAVEAGPAGVEIALCRCPTQERHPVQVVRPEQVIVHERGDQGCKRYVHDLLGPQVQASTLLVGETYTLAGNWSSYPPHKHDVEALPEEVQQEELYLFKLRPAGGFGLQYVYSTPDSPHGALDQAIAVRQDDVTLMPFGYHPVAAPPGYDVYYLWFLSGPRRLMRPHEDPAFAWMQTAPLEPRTYPR